jgi:hypothetical protein
MGKLLAFVLVGAAACGSNNTNTVDAKIKIDDAPPDQKVFMDAPPPMFDFSCIGNSPPTPNATVTVSGTVTEASVMGTTPSFNPLVGATIDACVGDCLAGNKLTTVTTVAMGAFTAGPLTTNGTAIDGYIRMTDNGHRTSYVYPPVPLAKDLPNAPVITFSPTIIGALQILGVCTQNDGANGLMAVVVVDCMGNPITDSGNITVSVKNGATPVGDAPFDVGAVAGSMAPQAQGLFIVCNVPEAAAITVGAKYKTMDLLSHNVGVTKATTIETEVRPGY